MSRAEFLISPSQLITPSLPQLNGNYIFPPCVRAKKLGLILDSSLILRKQVLLVLHSKSIMNPRTYFLLLPLWTKPPASSPARLPQWPFNWSPGLFPVSLQSNLNTLAKMTLFKHRMESCCSSVQNPPTAPHLTQRKSQSLYNSLPSITWSVLCHPHSLTSLNCLLLSF